MSKNQTFINQAFYALCEYKGFKGDTAPTYLTTPTWLKLVSVVSTSKLSSQLLSHKMQLFTACRCLVHFKIS